MDGQRCNKASTDYSLPEVSEDPLGGSDVNHQPNRKYILYSWKKLCFGHLLLFCCLFFFVSGVTVGGGAMTVASFSAHSLWRQIKRGKSLTWLQESLGVDSFSKIYIFYFEFNVLSVFVRGYYKLVYWMQHWHLTAKGHGLNSDLGTFLCGFSLSLTCMSGQLKNLNCP